MCGIIAACGKVNVIPAIIDGLKKVSYRGYDAWGIGRIQDGKIITNKFLGPVKDTELPSCNVGLGHSRWATNGENSIKNCHPHLSYNGTLAIVHNGIFSRAKEFGVERRSETDSEVLAQLVELLTNVKGDFQTAWLDILDVIKNEDCAFVLLFNSGEIFAYAHNMSLFCAFHDETIYVVSDIAAFPEKCTEYYILDGMYSFRDFASHPDAEYWHQLFSDWYNQRPIRITRTYLPILEEQHYTLSEIREQPTAIGEVPVLENRLNDPIYLIGSGSSYNAAMFGEQYIPNSRALLPHEAINKPLPPGTCILLSQSGESKDILDAVRHLKDQKMSLSDFAITNNANSALARLCNYTIPLKCGPEIGVAATKSFTSQLRVIAMLAGHDLQTQPKEKYLFVKPPDQIIESVIEKNVIYILGSGENFALAREAALKIQELSYIPAQAFYTQEFKHGPLALVESGTPILFIDDKIEPTCSQIQARGGDVFCAGQNLDVIQKCIDIQLLAYYLALAKGLNPDKPRNLAKSVTV